MDPSNAPFFAPGPALINQPPRIFGNLHANGSPIPAALPGPIFSQEDFDDAPDQGDPKRRRIARVSSSARSAAATRLTARPGVRCLQEEEDSLR